MSTIDVAQITQLGRYGVLIDRTAPALKVHPSEDGQLRVTAADGGSGIAADGVFAIVDGQRFLATPDRAADGSTSADVWSTVITVTDPALAGPRPVLFVARDRAGNEVRRSVVVTLSSRMPRELQLGANYPNPFNPETTIPLQVSVGARAGLRLRVYNAAGQVVRELLANTTEALEPGRHEVRWDGLDDQGRQVSSGVYFYRLESTDLLLTRSMTMLK